MPFLICYDIRQTAKRSRISKLLIGAGYERINKSVFIGNPTDTDFKHTSQQLQQQMQKTPIGPNDSLIILPITKQQIHRMQIIGYHDLDRDELTGDKSTLIF